MDIISEIRSVGGGLLESASAWFWALDQELWFAGAGLLVMFLAHVLAGKTTDNPLVAIYELFRHLVGRSKSTGKVIKEPEVANRGWSAVAFVEAEFAKKQRTGALCIWARSSIGEKAPLDTAAVLDAYVHTRDHAFVEAVTQTITLAIPYYGLSKGDRLLVFTSSEHAVNAHMERVRLPENRVDEKSSIARGKAIAVAHGVEVVVKHIHDAGGSPSKRQITSDICMQRAETVLQGHVSVQKAR